MTLSSTTQCLITKLIKAAQEEAFAGTKPPEDRDALHQNLVAARKRLEENLMDMI